MKLKSFEILTGSMVSRVYDYWKGGWGLSATACQ